MSLPHPPIVIVAAVSRLNHGIGHSDGLLWHIPDDLKRFKKLTLGHPIIMGRRTFESIVGYLGKPLPGRTNIVVTRDLDYSYDGAIVLHSLEEAIAYAEKENPAEIHIGGGAEIYRQALPLVSKLFITWIFDEKEADTFFPDFEKEFVVTDEHKIQTYNGLEYQWVDYERNRS
jgi:dihydrofolate reductase